MIQIDLTGRNAVITGGTRGIGRVISRRLAEAGAATVYRGDSASAAASLTERQTADPAARHVNIQADLAAEADIERLIHEARTFFPDGIDFLILNAGVGLHGSVTEIAPAEWRRLFDINLGSAFLLTRGLIPSLRRGGGIVAIGSGAGHDPIPCLALYGATKAGLAMFIADLAQEIGPAGIRANVVSPGSTDASVVGDAPSPREPTGGAVTHNALRRRGVPDDVAGVVLFLCSDLAGFVTGQAIRVNGGAI